MNRALAFSFRRASGVLVLLIAWFAMSNHCALGLRNGPLVSHSALVANHCCPAPNGTGEPVGNPPFGACCKSLQVLALESGGANLTKVTEAMVIAEVAWAVTQRKANGEISRLSAVATGPPEVRSFSEIVLQRSLQAHAPPLAG